MKPEKRIAWSLWNGDELQGVCSNCEQVTEICQNDQTLSVFREEMTFDRMCALLDDDAQWLWDQCNVATFKEWRKHG